MFRKEEIILGDRTYTVEVLPGNHGGWLFIKDGSQVIYEQPGYKDYEKALSDGGLIARAHYKDKYLNLVVKTIKED